MYSRNLVNGTYTSGKPGLAVRKCCPRDFAYPLACKSTFACGRENLYKWSIFCWKQNAFDIRKRDRDKERQRDRQRETDRQTDRQTRKYFQGLALLRKLQGEI